MNELHMQRMSAMLSVVACGSLYAAGVFVAGLVYDKPMAVALALVTVALGYIGSNASSMVFNGQRVPAFLLFAPFVGIATAIAAGVSLLV